MEEFNVLSLFDGMSCAMIALQRLSIKPDNYFASEIDKYAMQVSKANWPEIKHIGDVTKVHYFEGVLYTEFGNYEVSFANGLICGGSPCQGFSFAGKQLNFEDSRSKLFFEFVRIYEEIKSEHPDVKVFLENVVMKKKYQEVISEKLGLQPVLINSALVSAQNRKRLYWTNIPFQGQPEDREIYLKSILQYEGEGFIKNRNIFLIRDKKAQGLVANYFKGVDNHGMRTVIKRKYVQTDVNETGNKSATNRYYLIEGKVPSLCAFRGESKVKIIVSEKEYTLLTTVEFERCQCVNDGYTRHVSNTQAYKMLGNGWNVDTIVHLFEPLLWLDIL